MTIASPPSSSAAAILRIDLAALRANWTMLAARVGTAECAAVIKADAYGTGIEIAAPVLGHAGCRTFFVARLSEAMRTRAVLPDATIYVLDGLAAGAVATYANYELRPVIGTMAEVAEWAAQAAPGPCAIHIDTGMNRLGFDPAMGIAAARQLGASVALLMSHFSSSENAADAMNAAQIARFNDVRAALPDIPASLANSSGIFLGAHPFFDLVRPGYALYGGNPTPGAQNPMQNVVHLHAPVLQTRNIAAGERVGYNGQWTAARDTRLAIVPIGYADGIPRRAMGTTSGPETKPGARMVFDGTDCPIVGRMSMDLSIIDVTDLPAGAVTRGTMVEFLGDTIGIDELGERSGTIGYEILTNLGRRYVRQTTGN